MNDCYIEQLVKQRPPFSTRLKKAALIIATIIVILFVVINPLVFPIIILMIALDRFLFKRMDLEYEYVFFNGDLDIDKVMAKESRKRILATNIKDMDVIAPSGSVELQAYQKLKTYNYSTRTPGNKTYEAVITKKGRKVKVIFEPNEEILKGMRLYAPRKVFF